MRLLPDVGPKRVVICLASEHAFKDIPDVGEDIKVVAGCATDKCHEIRSAIASFDTAYYQPDGMTFLLAAILADRYGRPVHPTGGGVMSDVDAHVGLDVHKETVAVAIADSGRDGEVRYWGTIPNTTHHLEGLIKKLSKKKARLAFTYEAGPCGYDIYRTLRGKGLECQVIAP
jgi:hypothetical protein